MSTYSITLSIGNLLVNVDEAISHDFSCYIFVNNEPVYKLLLSDPQSLALISITQPEDKIELIFKNIHKSEIFGCVSLNAAMLIPFAGQKISQWITLFDSPDDDEFDGQIGVNDEEFPKALIQFMIDYPRNCHISDYESIHKSQDIKSTLPEKASLNINNSISLEKSQINEVEKKNIIIEKNEANQETLFHSLTKSANNLISDEVKPMIQPFDIGNNETTSAKLLLKMSSINETQPTFQDKINSIIPSMKSSLTQSNIQTKLSDVQEDLLYTESDVRQMIGQYEERLKLLNLEIQKAKEIDLENIKLKNIIDENNSKYEDSQKKAHLQFKQLFDKSTELNDENLNLKEKICDLEKELFNVKETLSEELRVASQNALKESEYHKAIIEHSNLRIKALEKVINDLNQQVQIHEKAYKREFEKNKKVVDAQTDLLAKYKKIVDDSQTLQTNLENKLKQADEERILMEDILQTRTNELQRHVHKIGVLEMDILALKNINDGLLKEVEEQKRNNNILNNSLNGLLTDKENEIINLRDSLNKSNSKINEIYSEYGKLQREKEFLQNEYNQISSRNYQNDILVLEERLEASELSRKSLQNELINIHKEYKILIETYQKNIQVNVNQDTALELEKKIKQLVEQFQVQTKDYDKLKFGYNALELKNYELQQKCEHQEELTYQLQNLKKINEEIKYEQSETKKSLHKTGQELIKQISMNRNYDDTIQHLQKNMQQLKIEMNQIVNENQKLQKTIITQQKVNDLVFEPYIPRKNDEIDQCLGDFVNKNRIPIKFIRIGEGIYSFGSKKIIVKIMHGKLVVRIGGGYMMLEEFIKLYATQELIKLRMMKNLPIQLTDVELDELPPEFRSEIIKEEENTQMIIKEIETNKLSELKVIPSVQNYSICNMKTLRQSPAQNTSFRQSPMKRNTQNDKNSMTVSRTESDRNATPKRESVGRSSSKQDDLESQSSEVYEICPIGSDRNKNRLLREAMERNRGISGLDSYLSSISNNLLKSPKEKDRTPWPNHHSIRKDVSPLSRKVANPPAR